MKNLLMLTLILSCASINQRSRDYYDRKHMRHGIIPLGSSTVDKLNRDSISRGKVLYEKNCLTCHGEKGEGGGRVPSLQKLSHEVKNFKFFMAVSQWQGTMPGWKNAFNQAQREDLVNYIKTFK